MDFLKSCTTNVRVVEDILQTRYTLLYPRDGVLDQSSIYEAIAHLRDQKVLCTAMQDQVWIFGELQAQTERLLGDEEYNLCVSDSSELGSDLTRRTADGRSLQEALLEALEGCISHCLITGNEDIIHVGSWQWLYDLSSGMDGDSETLLVSLHVKLDDSTLYISTTTKFCHVRPIRNFDSAQNGVLAPSGRAAKIKSSEDGQKPVISTDTWKRSVEDALQIEGIYLEPDEQWVTVELQGDQSRGQVLWPAQLCLSTQPSKGSDTMTSDADWTHWFGSSDNVHKTYVNPLAVAEEWFITAEERNNAAALPDQSTLDQQMGTSDNALASASMVAETPLATSPPFNQRLMDQQAAMSGIYPTPPDGLLPAHMASQNITSDVPPGPPTGVISVERSSLSNEMQLPDSDDVDQADRGNSLASSNGPREYHHHSDDLFGDMGEMDFGANEVGDADFDYFDEPDDLAPETSEVMGDTHMDVDMAENVSHDHTGEPGDQVGEDQNGMDDGGEYQVLSAANADIEHSPEDHTLLQTDDGLRLDSEVNSMDQPNLAESTNRPTEKPLSPFGIREHLLPPPIPASAAQAENDRSLNTRNGGTFEPVAFNENLDLSARYNSSSYDPVKFAAISSSNATAGPDISLPQKRKKPRPKHVVDPDSGVGDMMDTESEEDSYESATSMSDDEDMPPKLPWDSKKRKCSSAIQDQLTPLNASFDRRLGDEGENEGEYPTDQEHMVSLLYLLLTPATMDRKSSAVKTDQETSESPSRNLPNSETKLPPVSELLELNKLDLVYVAQLASEQAISTVGYLTSTSASSTLSPDDDDHTMLSSVESLMENTVNCILPEIHKCDISKLALVKEPPPRPSVNPGKAPQPPRPLHREGSMQLGPDYFTIPPPYIRIQRSSDTWEMLPPALSFWSALGLGPANGSKNIRTIAVMPGNEDLSTTVRTFMDDLSSTYESWKLGNVKDMNDFAAEMEEFDAYEEGLVLVGLDEEPHSVANAIKAYASVCTDLGKVLAEVGYQDPDRTIVVYLVDPFEGVQTRQHLSACFWLLYKVYRDNIPKAYRNAARADLVLQILPVSLIASPDGIVILNAQRMGACATEIYDRCPPSSKLPAGTESDSLLPILAAPAVELAINPPKRIGFQLSVDPPADLLHEGSILHLAYALSDDKQWVTVSWIDSTGRYQRTSSASLRGKSFKNVADEIWESTLEILTAREVTWRIFIVANTEIETSVQKCWRNVVASKARKQMLHVTLLSVQPEPPVQLTPSAPSGSANSNEQQAGQGGGFLTPVSTPQAATLSVSPDASGQTNAPLTPAPSDAAAAIPENDADAHLVDIADQSWGMLLASPASSERTVHSLLGPNSASSSSAFLASGLLFKRGSESDGRLASLGISLHWDIRVRPSGTVDEGPVRQAEATLREVVKMYRNLNVLTGLRHIAATDSQRSYGMMPVHIVSASQGASALDEFLG